MKSFISIKEFTRDEILEILKRAKELKECPNGELIKDKIAATLFFEPSTRTRLSFTSASFRIGAKVLGFDSPGATSMKKGESLRDTIKMAEGYADVIIMRHLRDGAARFADDVACVPVINAGDGANEHPSQTLLDLFTIQEEHGRIDNITTAFVGDLKYGRTVHSLARALSKFEGQKFYFVAPDEIQIPEEITHELDEKGIEYKLVSDYKDILMETDVLYMTRIQRERFEDPALYEKMKGVYVISKDTVVGKCKDDMIILHPLPRVDEIDIDLDDTKHALYFKQAKNGVPVREAMIGTALGKLDINYKEKKNILLKKAVKEYAQIITALQLLSRQTIKWKLLTVKNIVITVEEKYRFRGRKCFRRLRVLENIHVGGNYYLMKLKGEKTVAPACAGQFFMLQCKTELHF